MEELPYPELKKLMFLFDLNHDKFMDRVEWNAMIARNGAQNGVYAIKLDGKRGDLTKTNVLWRYDQKLPNIPSPLLYQNVLYILREGGIMTTLNPATGEIFKQDRVKGALDQLFRFARCGRWQSFPIQRRLQVRRTEGRRRLGRPERLRF